MTDSPSARDLRRWAAQCMERAKMSDREDRERLMKMRDSLLALAENAEWLTGVTMPDEAMA